MEREATAAKLVDDQYDDLTEAERLGLIVGSAYGLALSERDDARALAVRLEQELAELTAAAQGVLAMDAVAHPTFAHDEEAVDRLRTTLRSIQAPETEQD